jgi:hypothetical protein
MGGSEEGPHLVEHFIRALICPYEETCDSHGGRRAELRGSAGTESRVAIPAEEMKLADFPESRGFGDSPAELQAKRGRVPEASCCFITGLQNPCLHLPLETTSDGRDSGEACKIGRCF